MGAATSRATLGQRLDHLRQDVEACRSLGVGIERRGEFALTLGLGEQAHFLTIGLGLTFGAQRLRHGDADLSVGRTGELATPRVRLGRGDLGIAPPLGCKYCPLTGGLGWHHDVGLLRFPGAQGTAAFYLDACLGFGLLRPSRGHQYRFAGFCFRLGTRLSRPRLFALDLREVLGQFEVAVTFGLGHGRVRERLGGLALPGCGGRLDHRVAFGVRGTDLGVAPDLGDLALAECVEVAVLVEEAFGEDLVPAPRPRRGRRRRAAIRCRQETATTSPAPHEHPARLAVPARMPTTQPGRELERSRSGPAGDGLVDAHGHSTPAVVKRGVGVAWDAGALVRVLCHSE